ADGISNKSNGHKLAQPPHCANVLFLVASMDDGTSSHKQQCLEKCMCDQVEHSDRDTSSPQTYHHETELRHCGIGQDALNVGLRHRDAGGEHCRDRADP